MGITVKIKSKLLEAAYNEPNATTIAAMKEVESGDVKNNRPLDMSSIDAMEKSMGLRKR